MNDQKPLLVCNNIRLQQCPCCATPHIAKVGNINYPKNSKYSSSVVQFTEQPELWECQQCHSWFTQNIISEAESIRLYSAGGFWFTKSFQSSKPKEVVEFAAEILQSKQSVLDIGCANGAFLDFAQERGVKTAGLEFSAENRQLLKSKGHQAYAEWSQVTDRFDLITAFDVIEHLYDIDCFLDSCLEHLAENGILLLVTGNAQSVPAQKARSDWWYVRFTEHIICPSLDYFRQHPRLQIVTMKTVYSYKFSVFKGLKSLLKYVFAAKNCTPSPLLPPDHMLLCVKNQQKTDNQQL
jgi:SAM-dependent methyltransferase